MRAAARHHSLLAMHVPHPRRVVGVQQGRRRIGLCAGGGGRVRRGLGRGGYRGVLEELWYGRGGARRRRKAVDAARLPAGRGGAGGDERARRRRDAGPAAVLPAERKCWHAAVGCL